MTIRTILVDDEPLALQGLQPRLEPYEDVEIIDTCSNGREAVRSIKTHKPDLVFLDIQMPGFDGFSVIQGLMDVEPPLFVLICGIASRPLAAVATTSRSSNACSRSCRPCVASGSSSTRMVRMVIRRFLRFQREFR